MNASATTISRDQASLSFRNHLSHIAQAFVMFTKAYELKNENGKAIKKPLGLKKMSSFTVDYEY